MGDDVVFVGMEQRDAPTNYLLVKHHNTGAFYHVPYFHSDKKKSIQKLCELMKPTGEAQTFIAFEDGNMYMFDINVSCKKTYEYTPIFKGQAK